MERERGACRRAGVCASRGARRAGRPGPRSYNETSARAACGVSRADVLERACRRCARFQRGLARQAPQRKILILCPEPPAPVRVRACPPTLKAGLGRRPPPSGVGAAPPALIGNSTGREQFLAGGNSGQKERSFASCLDAPIAARPNIRPARSTHSWPVLLPATLFPGITQPSFHWKVTHRPPSLLPSLPFPPHHHNAVRLHRPRPLPPGQGLG